MNSKEALNIVSERVVLASLMARPNKIFDYDQIVINEGDFSNEITSCIYSAIRKISEGLTGGQGEEGIDGVILEQMVSDLYPAAYESNKEQFSAAISSVANSEISSDIKKHIHYIVTGSVKRKLKKQLKEQLDSVDEYNDPIQLIQEVESGITTFTNKLFNTEDTERLGDGFGAFIKQRIEDAKAGKTNIGISTGFPKFDQCIGGGMRNGTINLVGARAKRGKSFLGLTISKNVARSGIPVLYLDTELDKNYQMTRLAAQIAEVPLSSIESGKLSADEVERLRVAHKEITDLPIDYIVIKGMNIHQQVSIIRRWFARRVGKNDEGKYNPGLVVLDYLKLMDADEKGSMQEWQLMGFRMTALHDLMFKYNNPMFMLVQLNRDGLDREDEGAISQSDRISWLCDNFSILNFKSADEVEAQTARATDVSEEKLISNMRLKTVLARHGSGSYGDSYVGVYSDLRDPSIPDTQKCGIITETGLERPILDN